MAFVLKRITNEDEDYTPPMVFRSKIKIGSAQDSDITISSPGVLPLHCEIYPHVNEYRLVGIYSASILLNGKEPEQWPAVLNDGDILSFDSIQYKFHILHEVMRRSWKASFSSMMALFLLAFLILFELVIIFWLPYSLKNQKEESLSTMKQDTFLYIDNLRKKTHSLTADSANKKSIKNLLINIEDDIAIYLRKYRSGIGWEETRVIYRDLHAIGNIVDSWDYLQDLYSTKLGLDSKFFIDTLASRIQLQPSLDTSLTSDSSGH